MKFTQFMFPNGRRVSESIERSAEIKAKARELIETGGYSFEIECSPDTQLVNMDCSDENEPIAIQLCQNGPAIPETVDILVNEAYAEWTKQGKPTRQARLKALRPESGNLDQNA